MTGSGDNAYETFLAQHPPGQYAESWVACLDIMGYSDLIKRACDKSKAEEVIGKLRSALTFCSVSAEIAAEMDMVRTFRVFSDTIYFAKEAHSFDLSSFLYVMTDMVARLAVEGLFLRGAVVRGMHYDDGLVLFSPAFVAAYDMERKEAFYPRILLDDVVVADFEKCIQLFAASGSESEHDLLRYRNRIWRDTDGRWFLNYLTLFADLSSDHPDEPATDFLRRHGQIVAQHLAHNRHRPRISAKYSWLAHYHNQYCRFAVPDDEQKEFLIDLE